MQYSAEFVPQEDRQNEKLKTTPLLIWDYFMMESQHQKNIAKDLFLFDKLQAIHQWQLNWDIADLLKNSSKTILITDLNNEIIFASSNIYKMSGYFAYEVIGKTPKLLQGEKTDLQKRKNVRKAIEAKQSFHTIVVNYKKDGTPYTCEIEGHPMMNQDDEITNFIAFENIHHAST